MTQNFAAVEQLHLICQDVLGRKPTPAELGAWRNRLAGGMGMAQFRTQLARTGEAKLVHLFRSLGTLELTPELRSECLRRVARGEAVEEVARQLLAKLQARPAGRTPVPRSIPW